MATTSDPRLDHDPERGLIAPCPHCNYTLHPTSRGYCTGWPLRTGPWPTLIRRHPQMQAEIDKFATTGNPHVDQTLPSWDACRWVDHPWRMKTPDGWIYVAEPYRLDAAAFADLTYLGDNGWQVKVSAWEARHLPGRSLAVTIAKPGSRHPRLKG